MQTKSRSEIISEEISAECMLSPTIDAALALNRATSLFLNTLEDHQGGQIGV
jgi:hypothetical protein